MLTSRSPESRGFDSDYRDFSCAVPYVDSGVALVISVFYFSNDLPILIPLPLKPWEVLTSKFAVILANEYQAPCFHRSCVCGLRMRADVNWAVHIRLRFWCFSHSCDSYCSCFNTRSYPNENCRLYKRKDTLTIIGGFLLVGLIIAGQLYLQTRLSAPGADKEFIMRMLAGPIASDCLGRQFPASLRLMLSLWQELPRGC